MYTRLNHLCVCISYNATLALIREISQNHTLPLQQWIADGVVFKFWGDNVDRKRNVRDVRSDHQGEMIHMYSILAGRSRTQTPTLSRRGVVGSLTSTPPSFFLPSIEDVKSVKKNLVTLVSRVLTQYISGLSCLSKAVQKHILHKFSKEMSERSEVVVLDVLMKNENCSREKVELMQIMIGYLGKNYNPDDKVASGGDHLTCERQLGAQRHMMDGDTPEERLDILEPQCEDWHSMVCMLGVSTQ